jgi:hypothetical protein
VIPLDIERHLACEVGSWCELVEGVFLDCAHEKVLHSRKLSLEAVWWEVLKIERGTGRRQLGCSRGLALNVQESRLEDDD